MIERCTNCGSHYNTDTVKKCPICFPQRQQRRKDAFGIKSFMNSDIKDKKRTSTGYSHRVKTGGGSI
jgi:uncharacterized membrane protein YvbJ